MEDRSCHRIAIQERAELNRQDRELLGAASAHIQHIISEAPENKKAAEGAQWMLAVSEAERQAIAQPMQHEKTIIVENAQKPIQHDEAKVAGVTDEAQWRLAQEEIARMRIQSIAEQLESDSQQKAERGKAEYREKADAERREGEKETREQAARENQEVRN
eukprot:2553544-Pyramimonas_sp.AAC.1